MLQQVTSAVISLVFMISSIHAYESLQSVYDQAGSNGDYDKYIELNPETDYLGDLIINTGLNVYINGHGAVIYGTSGNRAIWVYASSLDLSHCIIVGGQNGIHYDTLSSGTIHNNTVVNCDSIGITVYYHDYSQGCEVWDNIVVGGMYGYIRFDQWPANYLGYNTVYNSGIYRYGDYCPG
jgi:hypothetical protein